MAGAGPLKTNRPFLTDPTVPRPVTRFPIMPTPFNYEKPSPQVPDVSLIFDSSSLCNQTVSPILRRPQNSTSAGNTSRVPRPPTPPPGVPGVVPKAAPASVSSLEAQMMYDLMKKQEEAIVRLEAQLKFVTQNQLAQSKNISDILRLINERLPPHSSAPRQPVQTFDQSVQTKMSDEGATKKLIETCTTAVRIQTSTSISEMHIASQTQNNSTAVEKNRSSSSENSTLSSISPPTVLQSKQPSSNVICVKNTRERKQTQQHQQQQHQQQQQQQQQQYDAQQQQQNHKQPINRFENNKDYQNQYDPNSLIAFSGDTNKEDLSTILRDLQLPTIQENSMFSEISIPPIDMQEFNDSNNESDFGSPRIGPSASACGSSASSDDEDYTDSVQPTMTFYRNVIGNVNKMLENNQDSTVFGSSDTTTIYGMSSNNLSFATKQYLQKYGLVEKSSKGRTNPAANGLVHPNNLTPEIDAPPRIFPQEPTHSHNHTPLSHENSPRILNMNALKNQPKFI